MAKLLMSTVNINNPTYLKEMPDSLAGIIVEFISAVYYEEARKA